MKSLYQKSIIKLFTTILAIIFLGINSDILIGQSQNLDQENNQTKYSINEFYIPMRDSVKLFTKVFIPRDTTNLNPILLERTIYGARPYLEDSTTTFIGINTSLTKEGFIFVRQECRGTYHSEGTFIMNKPYNKNPSNSTADESTDCYDTIDWLLKNIPGHNGRVGLIGCSYPGFQAISGLIDSHPALKAVSPQAPVTDFWFDDFHSNGAFQLTHAFNAASSYGPPTLNSSYQWNTLLWDLPENSYEFFLKQGSMNTIGQNYFYGKRPWWKLFVTHPNYDSFWQKRNILINLNDIKSAVLIVGGWFDAEDLYGTLKTYSAIENQNPEITNSIVMGPWAHCVWDDDCEAIYELGDITFKTNSIKYYQENIELAFFKYHLKDEGDLKLPEAYIFDTGLKDWKQFDKWPPAETTNRKLFMHSKNKLSFDSPKQQEKQFDEFISDPANPVPYTKHDGIEMPHEYMTEDQSFIASRPDVMVYQTEILREPLTIVGPQKVNFTISTSGTASDWIVKIIDVLPEDSVNLNDSLTFGKEYQMLVRGGVIRGRFRKSFEKPESFIPNKPTKIEFELLDVCHTFQKGHRIMIQVQSSWFPLVDRNPQKYVENIFTADEKDFIKTTQRIYRTKGKESHIQLGIL